jgi:hypothetical protein
MALVQTQSDNINQMITIAKITIGWDHRDGAYYM